MDTFDPDSCQYNKMHAYHRLAGIKSKPPFGA